MATELRLLGTVQISANGRAVVIKGHKPRRLLVALALNANRMTSIDRLVDAVWGDDVPRSALENLRTYATGLRKALAGTPSAAAVTTSHTGFQLRPADAVLDLDRFRTSTAAARSLVAAGDVAGAVTRYAEALLHWRGPAAEELRRDGWLGAALAALDEQHLDVTEEYSEAQLRLGQHRTVLGRLSRLVTEHPLRERLWRLLVLAQYRCGNLDDALRTHARARTTLLTQLGIDPSPQFADLHTAILRRDAALAGPVVEPPASPAPVTVAPRPAAASGCGPPQHLPPRSTAFVGRDGELAEAVAALRRTDDGPVTVVVHGPAGTGSSTLALHAAHAVRAHFPDGQLYLNLREFADTTPDAMVHEAARRVLCAVGAGPVEAATAAEAAATARSALAGRRILLLVDNAAAALPAAALLPAHPHAAAIVASTPAPSSPAVTHSIALRPLDENDAVRLLSDVVGADRAGAEPAAIAEIARCCAGLPIALRAAARRLAARSNWMAAATRDRLACEQQRLNELSLDADVSVRRSIAAAFDAATERQPDARQAFTDLARHRVPFDLNAARQTCCLPGPALAVALERLVDFGLLDTVAATHYRYPELTRLFALEQQGLRRTAKL